MGNKSESWKANGVFEDRTHDRMGPARQCVEMKVDENGRGCFILSIKGTEQDIGTARFCFFNMAVIADR
jgi:hypothetical protein